MLDGVVLARKTGAGALRRPVLVALGLRLDGKKEIIDFRLAASESATEWGSASSPIFTVAVAVPGQGWFQIVDLLGLGNNSLQPAHCTVSAAANPRRSSCRGGAGKRHGGALRTRAKLTASIIG